LRDCADQLRRLHGISIYIANREKMSDIYVVTARAKDRTSREDESTGAVPMGNLRGDALANALMKAETKAKRRVTLSIAGLGWLDETELETVKGVVVAVGEAPVATIHDALLDEHPAGPVDGTSETAGTRGATPPRPQPSAGPRVEDIPADVLEIIRAILARVVALYPGDKSDATVLEDRKNMLHAIFGCEIASGMAGVHTLAALGRDALDTGRAKLARLEREAQPPASTGTDAATNGADAPAIHPDIVATGELLRSLRERAGTAGMTPTAFQSWVEARQLPMTGDGEPILSVQERQALMWAFNEVLTAHKQAQTSAAHGDSARSRSVRASRPPRSGRS
jgi:hypothetical protein